MSDRVYTVKELLANDSFINYCFNKTELSKIYWDEQIKKNPNLAGVIQKAKDIILFKNKDMALLSKVEIEELRNRVFRTISIL